jgi:hypothetical protein
MIPLRSILLDPETTSAFRRLLTVSASSFGGWAIAKGWISPELAAALGTFGFTLLQVWSRIDRNRASSRAVQGAWDAKAPKEDPPEDSQ